MEFARHAALGVACGGYAVEGGKFLRQSADLIERIFRGTHYLVTLKREGLILDRLAEDRMNWSSPRPSSRKSPLIEVRTSDYRTADSRNDHCAAILYSL